MNRMFNSARTGIVACLVLIGFVSLRGFFGQTRLCSAFVYSNHLSLSFCFAISPVNASLFRMQWHPWLRDLCLPSSTLNVWIGPVSARHWLQPSLIGSRQIRLKRDEGFSEGREDYVVHTGWTSKSGLLDVPSGKLNNNQSYCMYIMYSYTAFRDVEYVCWGLAMAFQCICCSEDARILLPDCWVPGSCSQYESSTSVHMLYYMQTPIQPDRPQMEKCCSRKCSGPVPTVPWCSI